MTARASRGLLAYAIAYLAFLYAPVLLLPLFSVNGSIYIGFPIQNVTLDWYRRMLGNEQLIEAFKASVLVAAAAAAASTGLGFLAARALTRYSIVGRPVVFALILLPLIIPSLILAIGLLIVVHRFLGIGLSLFTVAIGHTLLCLPFSTMVLASRLEGFDRSLEDAALDLGDSAWRMFRRITLPLVWPAVVASFLLCFSASFDEYVLAAFLAGDRATLPVFIFSQLRFPQKLPEVLALGSCILVGSAVLVTAAELIRRRGSMTDFMVKRRR